MGHLRYLREEDVRGFQEEVPSSKLKGIMGVSEEGNDWWGQGYSKQRKQPVQSPDARERGSAGGEEEGRGTK